MLWVQLPGKVDALRLHDRAYEAGISIAPGPIFSPNGKFRDFVRLNCGWLAVGRAVRGRCSHAGAARARGLGSLTCCRSWPVRRFRSAVAGREGSGEGLFA